MCQFPNQLLAFLLHRRLASPYKIKESALPEVASKVLPLVPSFLFDRFLHNLRVLECGGRDVPEAPLVLEGRDSPLGNRIQYWQQTGKEEGGEGHDRIRRSIPALFSRRKLLAEGALLQHLEVGKGHEPSGLCSTFFCIPLLNGSHTISF